MNIAISHLAFNDQSATEISNFLIENKIFNLEIVLPKLLDWNNLNFKELNTFFKKIDNKIKVNSTQSLLYNSSVKDFLDPNFVNHIKNVIDVCHNFGIKTLVLGSPACRKEYIENILIKNFKIIDEYLLDKDIYLCIEPNSKIYNGKYFFNVDEICSFLIKGNFIKIKTMIDTHNLIAEGFESDIILKNNFDYIFHIHVSEIGLKDFIISDSHKKLSSQIKKCNYQKLITYEVLPSENLKTSILSLRSIYNNEGI